MAKLLHFGQAARDSLRKGTSILSKAVGVTLGPKGRTVILQQNWAGATVVADGFTIARELDLPNPFEDMGVMLVKDAADKTYDKCGDGTTTTIVLASAIINEANKNIAAGADPVALIQGIQKATNEILKELDKLSKPIESQEQLHRVAALASHSPKLGILIADAVDEVGGDGVILVEESKNVNSSIELIDGIEFEGGFTSPRFITDAKRQEAIIDDPHLLITDAKFEKVEDILPALERIIPITTSLVILCEDVEGVALAGLVMNRERGNLDVLAVKGPGAGARGREMLLDIAIATGGNVLPDLEADRLFQNISEEDLGAAQKVISTSSKTTILGVAGDSLKIKNRVQELEGQIQDAQTAQYRSQLKRRLGRLLGKTAIINVGGVTESEMKEKKHRVENAVASVQMAVKNGILPGAGVSLLNAISSLDNLEAEGDEITGVRILKRAAQVPIFQILQNAGENCSVIINQIMKSPKGYGFNAETGEFGDMLEMGIIEPAQLVKSTLLNASSIATRILSVDVMVVTPKAKGDKLDLSARYE